MLLSLQGKRVALANLTWAKDEVTKILNAAGATIVEMSASPELLVTQDPYSENDRKALLATIGQTPSISYTSLRELARLDGK